MRPALAEEARRRGVLVDYVDADDRPVSSTERAVEAVVDLLGDHDAPRGLVAPEGRLPAGTVGEVLLEEGGTAAPGDLLPWGWHRLVGTDGSSRVVVSGPRRLPAPAPAWGWWCHLPALRGPGSWGHGGVRELAALLAHAEQTGAGALLTTPLHPAWPGEASPYSPLSRTETDPLLIDVTALPEWRAAAPALRRRVAALRPGVGEATTSGRARLDLALDLLAPDHWPATDHAVWAALAEVHGEHLDQWPAALRSPGPAASSAADPRRVARHAWACQRAAEQLAAVGRSTAVRLLHDVPVGVHPGGSDAWLHGSTGLLVTGASVGAPPDRLGPAGQTWSCPPWHPARLAEAGCAPWRAALARALQLGGGLRLDHALQLWRLWWVPEGLPPSEGAYVRQDHEVLLAGLVLEAARADGVVVGEDLGTIPPEVAGDLAAAGVLGCEVEIFWQGVAPQRWRSGALASVVTHDTATVAGWWLGEGAPEERQALADLVRAEVGPLEQWADRLPGDRGGMHLASHALVTRAPSLLRLWGLGDALGDRRRVNVPGLGPPDYPSFRLPVAEPRGRPVPLPTALGHPGTQALTGLGQSSQK